MSSNTRPNILLAASLAALVGCGAADDPSAGADRLRLTATLAGTMLDENLEVVPSVRICAFERPEIPCVESDADGAYELALLPSDDVAVSYEKAGFARQLRMHRSTEGRDYAFSVVRSDAWYAAQAERLGARIDADEAIVLLDVLSRTEDALVRIDPRSGQEFYLDDEGRVDPSLRRTSGEGVGGFLGVEPGAYEMVAQNGNTTCPSLGPRGTTPGAAEVRAVAGWVTTATAVCP